jgi:hypothetical protein
MTTLQQQILRTHEQVKSGSPGARKRLAALQAEFRAGHAVERYPASATARLTESGTVTALRPRRTTARRPAKAAKLVREVELRDRGFVDYSVTLGDGARRDILGEIRRAHQAAGEAIEACGWLFSQYRPRADHNATTISLATRSVERSGTRGSVYLSDPIEALAAVRNAGYEHLHLIGDWHSHVVPTSELPSLQDARAWCGQMDALARDAYLSLVVSPSESQGWLFPRFSAWICGRYGSPSRPVVGRARMS